MIAELAWKIEQWYKWIADSSTGILNQEFTPAS